MTLIHHHLKKKFYLRYNEMLSKVNLTFTQNYSVLTSVKIIANQTETICL